MNATQGMALKALLESQRVAALATLHKDEPAVSMVPYALLPNGNGFVIHIIGLATHTKDMLANPGVALLVTAPPESASTPLALPRASLHGQARPCPQEDPDYAEARALYVARFPESEAMFSFSDFSLFIIAVKSVRFVGGFGQAASVLAEQFASVMRAER